jgi:acyl-coenzyme A synthetase/AMP-(fatty) acid ligase
LALIYDSPVTGVQQAYTYNQLRDEVARLAGLLRQLGVGKGDGVIIYMPMVPQAAMAMLACARIGAVHSVVFGGFAANELALRIDDARPTLLLTASCGLEFDRVIEYKPLVDRALQLARHQPRNVLVLQRPQAQAELQPGRDLDWQAAWPAPSRWPRSSWMPATRCTSCIPRAPPANPRASSGKTAAMPWRCATPCAISMACRPAMCGGAFPMWAGWSAIR